MIQVAQLEQCAIKMIESDTMTSRKVLLERACHGCEDSDCPEETKIVICVISIAVSTNVTEKVKTN